MKQVIILLVLTLVGGTAGFCEVSQELITAPEKAAVQDQKTDSVKDAPIQNDPLQNPASVVAAPPSPKKIVAVADFENKSGVWAQINIGQGMADMLTDALMKSGQFIVLERQALNAVIAEQNLGASGRATTTGAANIGGIKRAQILIQGAVTEFEQTTSGGSQGFKLYGVRVGSNRAEAHIAAIIRLIDTTTSQVLVSQRVEGSADRGGVDYGYAGGGFGFNQAGFSATPLGKATQIAIDQAVAFIASQMAAIPWRGKIIKVDGDQLYINAGSEGGIFEGALFMVFRPGNSVIDPDTGLDLGGEESFIGRLEIIKVHPKYALGKSLDKPGIVGDTVKFTGATVMQKE